MTSTKVVAIGLFLLSAAAGCKKPAEQKPMEAPPVPVTAAAAEVRDVPVYLDEIGRTVAREMVTVQPQVSGRVLERHFTDGADLKAGDALFTIDSRPFKALLDAAEANLAQSKATLDLAKVEFARSANLLEQKAVSQQDFDTTKSAVAVAEARVKQEEAAVDTAKLNLDYCAIRSPIGGRAGQRLVDVGNIVEANKTALLVVQQLDPIYVDFTVTEKNLGTVQAQMAKGPLKVEVRLENDPGPPVEGELTFVDNAVQKETGTVKLRASAANPGRRLWPGQFVKVRLIVDLIKDAVLIPLQAPQLSAQGPYVLVVSKESKAEARPIALGQKQGDKIVVTKGVQAGDQVITDIRPYVFPGARVAVAPPAGSTGGHP